MTEQQERSFPYYRSPSTIRTEAFSHRMRGLDEAEVREFLDLLADQVQAGDLERSEMRTENERLRQEVEQLRAQQPDEGGDINPQAVLLFSQAQQVADQLVEEAVIHARDLMTSARNQQREIMQETQSAAGAVGRRNQQTGAPGSVVPAASTSQESSQSVPDIEYVRTFARVAQVQLRSVVDALSEQVDRLGEVPQVEGDSRWVFQESTAGVITQRDWRVEPVPPQRPGDRGL